MSARELHPAATLIVVRDRAAGPPELLMIRRAATMAFGAGAWVFPGGRVDPGDRALADILHTAGGDVEALAARIAAIRETIEETGLAIGIDPVPDTESLNRLRAGLHDGRPFAALLHDAGLRLRLDALIPFSRWVPGIEVPRRFDTRFFLARAPDDAPIAVDGAETMAADWIDAAAMLARADARLLFPTACNLRRIAPHGSFADLAAHAALFPESFVTPEIREKDGVRYLCMVDGQGYPEITQRIEGAERG